MPKPTPRAVRHAREQVGDALRAWRRLQRLTVEQVADRANIAASTLLRLERGRGASLDTVLRVARALGIIDRVVAAFDPYETDVGRLRADEQLPHRVRRPKLGQP